ncbi:MAG: hypothetical protein QM765_13480 [Myxococcales bacterium]
MNAAPAWPADDAELCALLAAASDRDLHAFMCDCAEHALAVCKPIHRAAGYSLFPPAEPLEVKRRWLRGEASDEELSGAQSGAVFYCYWGSILELGAAVLGAAWHPGGGLCLAEDEEYAESMTWHETAREAAADVMDQCVQAVVEVHVHLTWKKDEPRPAQEAAVRSREAEQAWQRDRARAVLRPRP